MNEREVGIETMMNKIRIILLCIAVPIVLAGMLMAYGAAQIECPYCHNSDGNMKGNCVLRQRTGTCSEDYYAEHNNMSNCPWCGSRGRMIRFEAWKDCVANQSLHFTARSAPKMRSDVRHKTRRKDVMRGDRFVVFSTVSAHGDDLSPAAVASDIEKTKGPIMQGQRIFYTGHSFHVDIVPIMKDITESAGISGQENLGLSSIGGSRVIQHWDVPDSINQAKKALGTGKVDVLTMAPIFMPDEGIEKFATLALAENPKIRITVQEDWLWRDTYEQIGDLWSVPRTWDYDAITGAELQKIHEPVFKSIDEHVAALNQKFGKTVLLIVPAGQAVIALRERIIAGNAGELKTQTELFRDRVGHPAVPLQVLVAYCHYAVIYRRSPVGLPTPEAIAKAKTTEWSGETVRVLQEVAWEAVTQHPQSGVREAHVGSR